MDRLNEIEVRLAEIKNEVETRSAELTADEIKAFNEETDNLINERKQINADIEERNALINKVKETEVTVRKFEEKKPMEKRTFAPDTVEYRNAWLKNLQGKELDVEERAAIDATAVIPTETMNSIIGKLELNPIINAVDVTHIAGNISFPVEGTTNEANWVDMGTAATDSADTISEVVLGAFKLIKTIEISADVKAMSIPAFETWLVSRLVNKMEKAVAKGIIAGTGSKQATGLNSITKNTFAWTKTGMKFKDLTTMISKLPTEYTNGATFVMSRDIFYGQVLGMETNSGDAVVVADAQAPAKFNILGYPVILDDRATGIIFGDLKEGYKFNFASDIEVKADDSVAFRTGSTVYRGMCLADGKPSGVGVVRFEQATA